jgi:hypothetical protein
LRFVRKRHGVFMVARSSDTPHRPQEGNRLEDLPRGITPCLGDHERLGSRPQLAEHIELCVERLGPEASTTIR